MKNKPILLISPLPPPHGGIATWTKILLKHGIPDGSPVVLVDTRIRGNRNIFDKATFSLTEVMRTFTVLSTLIYRLVVNRPRVMHLSCSLSPAGIFRDVVCAGLAKLCRVPVISHYHGNVPDFRGQRFLGLSQRFLRFLMRHSQVNIVENQPSWHAARSLCPTANDEALILLPNFIEDECFHLSVRSAETPKLRAIFAGGITRAKGCQEILAAAIQLPDVEFHLFGKLHADVAAIFRLLPPNLILRGVVNHSELLTEMCASDFLLFPSYTEGFPLTVLEAMTVGLPVIGTSVGALPEMIDEGLGGYLVEPGNVSALIDAIHKLKADKAHRLKMGQHNRQKSFNQYRYSTVMTQLVQIYNRLGGH